MDCDVYCSVFQCLVVGLVDVYFYMGLLWQMVVMQNVDCVVLLVFVGVLIVNMIFLQLSGLMLIIWLIVMWFCLLFLIGNEWCVDYGVMLLMLSGLVVFVICFCVQWCVMCCVYWMLVCVLVMVLRLMLVVMVVLLVILEVIVVFVILVLVVVFLLYNELQLDSSVVVVIMVSMMCVGVVWCGDLK